MAKARLHGLYAVTPEIGDDDVLAGRVEQALRGGASLVQYRSKLPKKGHDRKRAGMLLLLCRRFGVPLIINDDIELASEVDADGVHLGRHDSGLAQARSVLGAAKLIGASCYDELQRARDAAQAGADYVAFGSMFPSSTKPNAVRASLDLLSVAKRELRVPVAAIGGITAGNAKRVIDAGADMVAVVSDLFECGDVAARARALTRLFEEGTRA